MMLMNKKIINYAEYETLLEHSSRLKYIEELEGQINKLREEISFIIYCKEQYDNSVENNEDLIVMQNKKIKEYLHLLTNQIKKY